MRSLLLVLAITAYALVFGEVFLRVFAPQPLVPRYVTGSADGIRANMPDVTFRQWTPEVDVMVHYNDAGMRDDRPAPALAAPPGQCRVALLGDSYFVGFESDYANSFGKQLEDDLAAANTPARVLNFAVSGFGTAEDLIVLQRRVAAWKPDVVVMSWHNSDPIDNIRSGLFRVEGNRLVATGAVFLPGVDISDRLMQVPGYRWLIENSHLYSAVRERSGVAVKALLARLRGRAVAEDGDALGLSALRPPPTTDAGPGFDDSLLPPRRAGQGDARLDMALLRAARDASQAMGAHFLVFDVPIVRSRTQYFSPQALYLGDLPGFDSVSPIADFTAAASPATKLYWEHGHLHWTPQGNRLAAAAAARAIAAREWLAGCGAAATRTKAVELAAPAP